MSTTYRLTERAEADVEAIGDFIARGSVDAAMKVVLALEDAFGLLASRPGIGHVRQDLTERPLKFWRLIPTWSCTTPLAIVDHRRRAARRTQRCGDCQGSGLRRTSDLGEVMSHDRNEKRRRCGLCRRILRPDDLLSGVGDRCYRCFNDETADQLGVAFDNTAIAPFAITDVDGVRHRFEIRSILVPTGHAMYAREVGKPGAKGGYRFEILGDLRRP